MTKMRDKAVVAHGEDEERGGVLDWLRVYTSFMKPLHCYDGELALEEDRLVFGGRGH